MMSTKLITIIIDSEKKPIVDGMIDARTFVKISVRRLQFESSAILNERVR